MSLPKALSPFRGAIRTALVLALSGWLLTSTEGCATQRPPAQKLPMQLLRKRRSRRREVKTTAEIVGVVLTPTGAPLDSALITAVNIAHDPEDGKEPLFTTSIQRGKFRLKDVPPGKYGLTVTAPPREGAQAPGETGHNETLSGAYAGVISAQRGETGPPLLLRLGPQSLVLVGHMRTESGEPIAGAFVRAVRMSPYQGDHFFARTDDSGRFVLGVPDGRYFLVGQAEGKRPVRVDLNPEEPPKDIAISMPPALVLPEPRVLTDWISQTGAALPSSEEQTANLDKLTELAGRARILAFGEAGYTSHEIAVAKLQMLRHCVEKMGFSTLLIEATEADVRPIDEHLQTGQGDLPRLVKNLGYFSLDSEEMLAVFKWMRQYNEDRRHRIKLRVFGVDVQRTVKAATYLDGYLAYVDKKLAEKVETTLSRLRTSNFLRLLRLRPLEEQEAVLEPLTLLEKQITKRRQFYTAKSSWTETVRAQEDAAALVWAVRVAQNEQARGAAMADVAKRRLSGLPPGTKAVLWAHSTQVSKRPEDRGMGSLLSESLKKDYVAMAMTFYQGWVRAWDFTQGPTLEHGTKLFRLGPAEPATLEALLQAAGEPMFFADVRKAPAELLPWLTTRLPMRSAGGAFESESRARTRTVVKEAFDGLFFVKRATTVKLNESGRRAGRRDWD